MLVKIKPIGEEFVERFLAVKEWPEVIFTNDVVALLSEFKFVDKVYKSSVRVKIDAKELTHTHLPSQYFLYAVLIKEFAVALYKYMVVFESLKLEKLKNAEINQLIVGRKIDSRAMQLLTTQEQNNFFDLFGLDDSLALNAKSILSGDTGLRGVSDFFGSVILKVINVPDTSNKRKVGRGGSWKDVAYFLQVGTRDFEYQDTARSYIGFRTVQDYMGTQTTGKN